MRVRALGRVFGHHLELVPLGEVVRPCVAYLIVCRSCRRLLLLDPLRDGARFEVGQKVVCRLVVDDSIGNGIRRPLVSVSLLPHPVREMNAGALLHGVRGFVRAQPQAGSRPEGDLIAEGVRRGSEGARGRPSCAANMRADRGQIVFGTKCTLDRCFVRQTGCVAGDTGGGGGPGVGRVRNLLLRHALHGRRGDVLGVRPRVRGGRRLGGEPPVDGLNRLVAGAALQVVRSATPTRATRPSGGCRMRVRRACCSCASCGSPAHRSARERAG